MLDVVDETVSGSLWSNVGTTKGGTLSCENTLPGVSVPLVGTKEETDLASSDTNVTSWHVGVVSDVSRELSHEGVTESSDLVVRLALWIEVSTSLSTSHGETSEGVLEDLLESEELEDGEIDSWVESETSLVWTEGGVVLDSETTVDHDLALVGLPDDPELDDSLWDGNDLESLLVLRVCLEESRRVEGRLQLIVCLLELETRQPD